MITEIFVFILLSLVAYLVVYMCFRFLHFPGFFFKLLLLLSVAFVAFASLMYLTGLYKELPFLGILFEKIRAFMDWFMGNLASIPHIPKE